MMRTGTRGGAPLEFGYHARDPITNYSAVRQPWAPHGSYVGSYVGSVSVGVYISGMKSLILVFKNITKSKKI